MSTPAMKFAIAVPPNGPGKNATNTASTNGTTSLSNIGLPPKYTKMIFLFGADARNAATNSYWPYFTSM
jgi:hypothetical protein